MQYVNSMLSNCFRSIARRVGLDVYRWRNNHHYVPDYYGRTAGKHIDIRNLPEFGKLAGVVISQQRTLLYYDRLYIIYQALRNLKSIVRSDPNLDVAEVGVYKGGTSYFIASTLDALKFQSVSLHCFDTFEGHSSEDIRVDIDTFHKANYFNDTDFQAVKEYLKPFCNVSLYKGRFQDTSHNVSTKRFCFVHLDVDIYEPMLFGLNFFDSRLIVGGCIIVDDYGISSCSGVIQAVEEFLHSRNDYFLLHLLSGQCVLVKYQ